MNSSLRKPAEWMGRILNAGLRAVLLVVAIEAGLLAVAMGAGIFTGLSHGALAGLISGILAFLVGQALAVFILDMILELPERSKDPGVGQALESLKRELGAAGENDGPPNP